MYGSVRKNRVSEVLNLRSNVVYWLGSSLCLNIANRCSSNCYFCFRHYWRGIGGFDLRLIREPSVTDVINELLTEIHRGHWREVVFCGFGEPTIRLDCVLQVTRWIKEYSNLRVRIDTNGHGYLLNPRREVVGEFKEAGVDDVSVSLDGHDKETYDKVCRPIFPDAYELVLEFVQKARRLLNVEITAVRLPEIKISEVERLSLQLGAEFRLREYIPCFY